MRRTTLTTTLLLGTLALLLTGCSRDPVSPQVARPGDGASPSWGVQTDDPPAPQSSDAAIQTTLNVATNGQGTLRVGRFTLRVPRNSLRMPTSFTLTVASPDAMEVAIQVSPAAANDFEERVELIADLSDRPDLKLYRQTFYWWKSSSWVEASRVSVLSGSRSLQVRTKRLWNAKVDAEPDDDDDD